MLKNAKLWQFSWSQACEKLSNKRVGIKCHEKKRHFFTQQYEDYIFLLNIKSVLAGYIFTSLLIHHQQVKFLPNISPSSLVPTSSILRPILVSYLFTPVQLIFSPPTHYCPLIFSATWRLVLTSYIFTPVLTLYANSFVVLFFTCLGPEKLQQFSVFWHFF